MALLNEEDDKEKEASKMSPTVPTGAPQQAQPAGQPVNPIVPPQSTAVPRNLMGAAPAPKQPKRVGTGFTNLNRIMQANQGNRLGQTVAGGVTGQVQNLQSGVQQSQQQFGQQSEAGRLDTPEAAAQRASVLGRFDTANFKPDESKFAVSSGLQTNYDTQKSTLAAQQAEQKAASDKQRATIQARYDADAKTLAAAKADAASNPDAMGRAKAINRVKTLNQSLSSLKGLLGAYTGSAQAIDADTAAKLANIESQYGTMSASEKANWIKAEQERMVSEQLPTDEEAENFRRFQTGTYTGPKELQDYGSLLGKAQQTEELGTLSRSSGGRQELLKQFVGGRDYTQGQRGLDSALMGQDDNSLLSRAAKKAFGAEKGVAQANLIAGNQAQELTNKARQFGEETRGQITAAGAPISAEIDADVASAQAKETERQAKLKNYQDILAGKDPKYAGMDQLSRTGLALQDAANSGYLDPAALRSLMGDDSNYGLLERGMKSGVDINALLSGAFTGTGAKNITRAGVASGADVARLNALDRLAGKTGTDQEFGTAGEKYQAGGIGMDNSALQKAVNEAEGYKEPVYGKPGEFKLTPTQQMAVGAMPAMKAMSGTREMGNALAGAYGQDFFSGENTVGKAAEGSVQTAVGAAGMVDEGENAILKRLVAMSGTGKYGGKQVNDLINYQSQLKQQALGSLNKEGTNMMSGIGDINKTGRLDQALAKLSGFDAYKNVAGNIGREVSKGVSTALSGGKTGDWATSEYNTIDATTGKKNAIGTYANKSSQDILKQMLSTGQMARTGSSGKGGAEGAKAMNELLKYYQAALKREGKKK
jgi:hypothetical protein